MSGLRTVAIAGSGNLGRFIIEELFKNKDAGTISSVIILTRSDTSENDALKTFAAAGARAVQVDYAAPASSSRPSAGTPAAGAAHGFARGEGRGLRAPHALFWKGPVPGLHVHPARRSGSTPEDALRANPADFLSALLLSWNRGGGLVGTPEQLDNKEWPEWAPKAVLDVLL